jgi:hypothetical protein
MCTISQVQTYLITLWNFIVGLIAHDNFYCLFYKLLTSETLQRRMEGSLVNNEQEIILSEAIMA